MRQHVHVLLVSLVVVMTAAGADADLVKPQSYYFAMTTLQGDASATDPDFSKLTDGKKDGPERVIWRKNENHGVPFTIAFDFRHDTSAGNAAMASRTSRSSASTPKAPASRSASSP